MFQFISYIGFLLRSKSRHGVHSPFVYQYITRCLHAPDNYHGRKTYRVVLKSILYFGSANLLVLTRDPELMSLVERPSKANIGPMPPYDLVYADGPAHLPSGMEQTGDTVHNDTVVIIDNIHKNRANFRSWKSLVSPGAYTVTMDLYYCGILFFRREQAKEHFRIRI